MTLNNNNFYIITIVDKSQSAFIDYNLKTNVNSLTFESAPILDSKQSEAVIGLVILI